MKNKIIKALIYILTIATLITMIIVQKNLNYVAWTVGTGATLIGILSILQKNNLGYIIFAPGFSLFISVLLYTLKILDKSSSVTMTICLSVNILMLVSLFADIIRQKNANKIYSKVVEAQVTDLVRNPNTKKEYYQVIYEYVIGKDLYTVGAPEFINKFIPRIGDTKKLKVNSKDFADVLFEKSALEKLYEKGLTIGLILVTLIIIISLFI